MYKKRPVPSLNDIEYEKCIDKIKLKNHENAQIFADICRVASGLNPNMPTNKYKFIDLWFNDPSVIESVFSSINRPNLCFLHPIYVDEHGNFLIHQHLGRGASYNVETLVPQQYRHTVIDKCNDTHMAIPLMFDDHVSILLVIKGQPFIVEHFEPHGPVYHSDTELKYNIEQKSVELVSLLFEINADNIQYISPAALCQIEPQFHVKKSKMWSGTCSLWSMLYAFKRLINPETGYLTTMEEINDMARRFSVHEDLIKATIEAFMNLVEVDERNYLVNSSRRLLPDVRREISNEFRKRKGGNLNKQQLLIVFDIDETLIHYVPAKYNSLWKTQKHLFPKNSFVEILKKNGTTDVVIFRPHLQQLFHFIRQNQTTIKVALWTYSERDYAQSIANTLMKRFGLPSDFFLFLKGAEDIDDDNDYAKNLQTVYGEHPEFNVFNTVLVDDRYANIRHKINSENGLLIEPFAPFGLEKARVLLDKSVLQNIIENDNVFLNAIQIFKAVHKDIMGCDESDIEEGFLTEPVFSSRRLQRMGLETYLQSFAIKPQRIDHIISIGTPYLTSEFVIVKPGLELYGKQPTKTFGQASSSGRAAFGQASSSRRAAFGQASSSRRAAFGQASSSGRAAFGRRAALRRATQRNKSSSNTRKTRSI